MAILMRLTPKKDNLDFTDIVVKVANNQDINLTDYKVESQDDSFYNYLNEIEDYILEHGVSSLLTLTPIFESLIAKGTTPNKIIAFLHRYLDKVDIDDELIIIDPYFFASTNDINYTQTIFDVLERYLPVINNLIIITDNRIDDSIKSSIEAKLISGKSTLRIIHKITNNYHDRFWISNNREKGIITGTSLNGLGRKFALIDRLNITDVREIIDSLKDEGLL